MNPAEIAVAVKTLAPGREDRRRGTGSEFLLPVMRSSSIFDDSPPSLARRQTSCVENGRLFLAFFPFALLIFLEFPIDLRSLIIIHIHTVLLVTFMRFLQELWHFIFQTLPRQNQASAVPTTRSKLGKKSQKCLLYTTAKPCYISNLEFHQSFEHCFALRG